jgi:outer membrane protein assembly factor BamB
VIHALFLGLLTVVPARPAMLLDNRGTLTYYDDTLSDAAAGGIVAGPDRALWFTDTSNDVIGPIDVHGKYTRFTGVHARLTEGITSGQRYTIVRRSTTQTDWPQLGFDPAHSAYNPYEKQIGVNNVAQLQQAWSFSAGSGNNVGNVIEAGGIVYAPSGNGMLFAIDASTGSPIWSFPSGSGFSTSGSAPSYDSHQIFTVCNVSSSQGVCALNAADGSLVWSYVFPGSGAYAGTPPVATVGTVLFEACATSGCSYVSLNESNGFVAWTVPGPPGHCEGNGGVTPAVASARMYVGFACAGSTSGEVLALGIANGGNTKWTFDSDAAAQNAGLSVAGRTIVYFAGYPSQGNLPFRIDATTGEGKIRGSFLSPFTISMPAIAKKVTFATIGTTLYAFKTTNGKHRWSSNPSQSTSWPSVANGVVYTACAGSPCAYDTRSAEKGVPLWSGSGTATYGVPIIVNFVVYAACQGSNVCAWALPGSLRRR